MAYEAFVLREDGEVRGTAIDRATARDPYGFVVGSGDVIRGLSEGVKGMRPGGRRLIEVPWQYAYGSKRPAAEGAAQESPALRRPAARGGRGVRKLIHYIAIVPVRVPDVRDQHLGRAPEPDAELRVGGPVR